MEVHYGPESMDQPNLLYKLQRKIKVFNTNNSLPNRGYNLVASSSKYGVVFVAAPDRTLSAYYLKHLVDKECEPQHLTIKLQEIPSHIAVSCDHELLAVTGGQLLCFYKVSDCNNKNACPALVMKTGMSPSNFVSAFQWNPCIPDSIAIAFHDGTLIACQVSSGQTKKVPSKARCICWSPKGKQLVTGNSDGTLVQYKPDLTAAKTVPAPNLFEGCPVEALAIYWISTYQFAVVYKNATDNSRPAVTIVNTPKGGQPSCVNYEDICYSMGSNRPWYYYLQGLAQWSIIMTASSNSMEMSTLGSADGASWLQWCQPDEARPELPLTDKKIENYPVGICIDTCAIHQLPWGENETLPHMPLLHVVSQNGLLTIFNIINLNKEAPQVCTPPQQFALSAESMTSAIPDDTPGQPVREQAPAPVADPKPQPSALQQALQKQVPPQQPATQPAAATASATIRIPSYQPQSQGFAPAPVPQQPEPKPVVEIKPAAPQPQVTAAQKPQAAPAPKPQPTPQQFQENAALKAEQEKINKIKANQELKNMLVKEVNDFQSELYNFMLKTRETQARLQRDLKSINWNFNATSLDTEQLKKECSIEELRGAIVQLKLELVRACAVVAEARTHADAKDLHQWTQADPLTTKRVASVKKLAYYVQTQLEQAHKALDCKWNEMASKDPQFNKPGKRMIRPILDDVYQPLVKQQEILSRQQAVLRTLRNQLNECDASPLFKSTSLLRSTPFRNKDPLSKLTKNILNMSIEPQTKPKQSLLTPTKLDALRDVLSNHKTVKIKPVNVELRQHLATLRNNYEKSLREKAAQPVVKTEPEVKPKIKAVPQRIPRDIKIEPKSDPTEPPVPAFTPVSNIKPAPQVALANVARTLFTDEPKQEPPKPLPKPAQTFGFGQPASADTKSVLKDLLTNKKQAEAAKNNSNTFMGQIICSPSAFGQPSAPTSASAPSAVFTSKPIVDINNMFNKFQPQTIVPESKAKPNIQSSETGEVESTVELTKAFDFKAKDAKPMTNLFGMKAAAPIAASTPNVPDVLKITSQEKIESKIIVKPSDKKTDKTKENVPAKSENVPKPVAKPADMKDAAKPLSDQMGNKGFSLGGSQPTAFAISSETKPVDLKTEPNVETAKVSENSTATVTSSGASIFASASTAKPQSAFTAPAATKETSKPTKTDEPPSAPRLSKVDEPSSKPESKKEVPKSEMPPEKSEQTIPTDLTTSASSIFGAAVASQHKTTDSVFSSSPTSLFSSASFGTTTQSSVFGSKPSIFSGGSAFGSTTSPSSLFGQTSTTQSVFASTAASVFASAASSQPSVLGTATTTTPSVTTTETSSVFGSKTTPPSVFGSTTPASVFGSATTTQASVFGATTTPSAFAPTTTSSIFGAATTTASIFSSATTQASSVFGQATQSVFGAPTTTKASIFGAPTTQASVFGSPTTQTSVFGSPTATTQTSVFGSPTATTQTSVFGTPTQTTQASIFGTPTQTTQAPVFGTPTQTTQASVFGTPTETTQASLFGTPTQTTQSSIFGAPPVTTVQSGSLFGGGEANLFASASISTTSTTGQGSGGNIFSGGSPGSVFGGGSNVFGGKAAFGQANPTAAAIFGGGTSFGQTPATNIWGSGNTSAGGFGSSGFGQTATTQSSSIFGGGSGGSFSAPSAGAFGSSQQPSAFGSPQQQQTPAFGGSPVFGSKPVFGQPTGFGSPSGGGGGGFGAPAAFGGFNKSPGGGFGSPPAFGGGSAFGATSSGFGSPTQSSSTFENLASQNTLTFGNLAQQSGQPQQQAPTFNTSPSFTGWRG